MKPTYRVIILDDEPPARDLIETFVNQMPDMQCLASCSNAMQGLQAIQDLKPDLLFLDIQMPEMTGLELIKLPLMPRPEIILTTAFPEYALTSYDYSVLDYLVKPIAFDRFVKSIVKFWEKRQLASSPAGWHPIDESQPTTMLPTDLVSLSDTSSIWLREEKRLLQIPYREILYVEGLKDYVKVHLKDQVIVTHMSLGKAEKFFAAPQFVRVHRSFLVLLAAIRLIDGNSIILTNGKQIIMGPHYREELKKYINALV